jgi:threonine/homoserine/homoserine lactone efflux protein
MRCLLAGVSIFAGKLPGEVPMQSFPLALILTSIPFMASMGITPGPNNVLVASSGVNFGFRATLPHILGITIGYPLMLFIVGIGLAKIFIAVPLIHTILKWISIVYLLYLAYRITIAAAPSEERSEPKPLTFLQAAAFQWVNGKAWVISLGAVTTYTVVDQTLPLQIVALTAISVVITLVSVSCWTFFGAFMRRYLQTEKRRRWFNYTMAALLVLSILPVLWE